MKKTVIAWLLLVVVSAAAQSTWGSQYQTKPLQQGFDTEGYLLDHDSVTAVRCSQWAIKAYMDPGVHKETPGMWSSPSGRHPKKHECHSDNKLAQEVYQARLNRRRNVSLSHESELIVSNFELLTGTRNSIDHNLVGTQYVSSMALTAWELWFNKHKEQLRICPRMRVLYIDTLEELSK